MTSYMYFCTPIVSAVILVAVLMLLSKAAYSTACTVSVIRWMAASIKVYGSGKARPWWPLVLPLIVWPNFFVNRYGKVTYSHSKGRWKGLGKWHVYPAKEQQK